MHLLIAQLLWFGLAALVIVVDRQLAAGVAAANAGTLENYDLADRRIGQYLVLQLLFGGFVIPFYLWNSRKTGSAALLGVGLMIVCAVIVYAVLVALAPRPF